MADASERIPRSELEISNSPSESGASPRHRPRLQVVGSPSKSSRENRPIASLGTVFGRFAETQQQVGDQVDALEDSVEQQGRQLADISAQLPDLRERLNWLIATYHERELESRAIHRRLEFQEAGLAELTDAVRTLCKTQAESKQLLDQLIQKLGRT